jgi:hypothetical protein
MSNEYAVIFKKNMLFNWSKYASNNQVIFAHSGSKHFKKIGSGFSGFGINITGRYSFHRHKFPSLHYWCA